MLAYLKGKIQYKDLNFVIVNIGNLGYQVFVAPVQLAKLQAGQEAEFFTYEHSREDSRELYGFLSMEELKLFKKIISVSGVGPKSGQNILALDTPGKVESAIERGDVAFLTRVSGVGKKIAERMILELKGKLVISDQEVENSDLEAIDALVGLGYSKAQARQALGKTGEAKTAEEKVKEALKVLGK